MFKEKCQATTLTSLDALSGKCKFLYFLEYKFLYFLEPDGNDDSIEVQHIADIATRKNGWNRI
jgi:hypothetical protein